MLLVDRDVPPPPAPPPRRAVCARCRRPEMVCYCRHLAPVVTRTRFLLLQHARERHMGIGTARMAHLGLAGSQMRVGVDFDGDPVVAAALAGPAPAYVLFPGAGARDVAEIGHDSPITLVVVDGTWSQAKKLLKLNPRLAALPRVAFTPRRPSAYRIRRQPAAFCLSTIEAIAEVLETLEPDPASARAERLLGPFRAMVEAQERFARDLHDHRHEPAVARRWQRRAAAPRPPALPARLRADWERIVCVQGEANAWPKGAAAASPPELVHWVAHRPATGATLATVIAPRGALAPATARYIDLPPERLAAGVDVRAWLDAWRGFVRDGDLLVHWGSYHRNLGVAQGLAQPARALDLRAEATRFFRRRIGTVEECASRLGAPPAPDAAAGWRHDGRGGRRLGALVDLVTGLVALDGVGVGTNGAADEHDDQHDDQA